MTSLTILLFLTFSIFHVLKNMENIVGMAMSMVLKELENIIKKNLL